MKNRNRIPVPQGAPVTWASNGVGLARMSNATARQLAARPEDDWDILSPQAGSGDEIRLVEHGGLPVVLFVGGRDHRCPARSARVPQRRAWP